MEPSNVFYLMEFWCCFVDVVLSFHPRKAGKAVESVMQPNGEVRGEHLYTWERLQRKGLKLVCGYVYIYIYMYKYTMHEIIQDKQTII